MMNKKWMTLLAVPFFVAACAPSGEADITSWMNGQEKNMKGKIKDLPPAKTFTPVTFNAKADPFKPKGKVDFQSVLKNQYAPDMQREREALEEFDLSDLKMTGTMQQRGVVKAYVKDKNGKHYDVKVGQYMGKNHGVIVAISDWAITLEERIQVEDEWIKKTTTINLFEGLE